MPWRQLQPAAHSLLAGYLLLRISLHEWLLWNILEPATKIVCISLYSSYSEGLLFMHSVPSWMFVAGGWGEICLCQRWQCWPLRTFAVLCRTGGSCLAKKKEERKGLPPPLCTGFNHSTVNFKTVAQKKGLQSKPPDFLSHLLLHPPSHLSTLIHFNYASSHFFWSLYSTAAPVLIVAATSTDTFCSLERVGGTGDNR